MRRSRASTALAWLGIAGVYALLRANLLEVPLGRDEGGYAYVGRLILEGGLPYRDALDHRPPGVFYLKALGLALFPSTTVGVHLFLHLFTFASVLAVYALARDVARSRTAGLAAALAMAVTSASPAIQGFAAATEMYMMLPLTLCMGFALRAERSGSATVLLAAGACGALACWIKQPAATSVAFAAGWAAWGQRPPGPGGARAAWRALALFALGGAAVSVPIVLYFAAHGLFDAFVYWSFLHSLLYSAKVDLMWPRIADRLLGLARGDLVVVLGAIAAIAALLARRRREGVLLAGFLLAALLGTLPGKAYKHYFCQLVPPLCVAFGVGAGLLLERVPRPPLRAAVAAVGALLVVGVPVLVHRHYYVDAPPERIAWDEFGQNPFVESPAIANFLQRESAPDDAILILGSEPQILFLAERRSAIPYLYLYPLLRSYPRHREFQQVALARIERDPPPWILTTNMPFSLLWDGEADRTLLDEVQALVQRDYELRAVAIVGPGGGFFELPNATARRMLQARLASARHKLWVFRRRPDATVSGS